MGKGQLYGEGLFDILYLFVITSAGLMMLATSNSNLQCQLFAASALVLGFGDAFHLIPRILSIYHGNFDKYSKQLGFGKLVTSITSTIYYLLMFNFISLKYNDYDDRLSKVFIVLIAARIFLCILPINKWFSKDPPIYMNYLRNIPFIFIGIIIVYRLYIFRKVDPQFEFIYVAFICSFLFYLPVAFLSHKYPKLGLLMIPKTCAYLYIVFVGYKAFVGFNHKGDEL